MNVVGGHKVQQHLVIYSINFYYVYKAKAPSVSYYTSRIIQLNVANGMLGMNVKCS